MQELLILPDYSLIFSEKILHEKERVLYQRKVWENRVGMKPGFYHKAQPGGFFCGRVLYGFLDLKVFH